MVGIGNSGAEIAADLVEQGASRVAIAVRTPPPIVPRELFGVVPVQLFGIALMPLRRRGSLDRVGSYGCAASRSATSAATASARRPGARSPPGAPR